MNFALFKSLFSLASVQKIHDHSQTLHHQILSTLIAYHSCSSIHWLQNHHLIQPHSQFLSHDCTLEYIHTHIWPLLIYQRWIMIQRRRQWNQLQSTSLLLIRKNVHASRVFNKKLKTWREKTDVDETYETFVPFMTQQEEDCLNNQPTSGTAGFRNVVVYSIVHDKMQQFINQMETFYQYPYEEESLNIKLFSQHFNNKKCEWSHYWKHWTNVPENVSR